MASRAASFSTTFSGVWKPFCGRSEKRAKLGVSSWSWASVNGKVSYWDEPFQVQDLDKIDAPLPPGARARTTSERTQAPSGDLLHVVGRLTPATLNYTRTASGEVNPMHYELSYSSRHAYLNANLFLVTKSERDRTVSLYADYCLSSDGVDHIEDQTVLYCLGTLVGETFTVVFRPKIQVRARGCLVHYERVGVAAIPHVGRKTAKGYFYAVRVEDAFARPLPVTLM